MNPQDNQRSVNPSQSSGQDNGQTADQNNQQPANLYSGQPQPVYTQNSSGASASGDQPQLVFVSRPHEPVRQEMSDEVKQRYLESKQKYPDLNLSEGEFIISAVKRHPIGLLQIWAFTGILLLVILAVYALVASGAVSFTGNGSLSPALLAAIPALLISALVILFGTVATIIYNGNRFYLTNESVIQQIQTSLFSKREQTVSLSNIEDASYTQHGVVQHMFDYGMIRLSTEGDETTYRFSFASKPKQQIATLNNAVEAFKNGRPVTGD